MDLQKLSFAVARSRKDGKPVCLHVGFDVTDALAAAEKADPAKFDQVHVYRKPPVFKRKQLQAPEPA